MSAPTPPSFRKVSALRGAQWLVNAYYLFMRDARMWMLFVLVLLSMMLLMAIVPLVGPLVFGLVFPVLCAGLGLAALNVERGEPMRLEQLFAGFRTAPGDLVAIGGFYLVGQVLVSAVVMGVGGDELQQAIEAVRKGAQPSNAGVAGAVLLAALAGLAFTVPLVLATWFAPLLVFFDRMRVVPALQLSLRAGLRNLSAFLIYAVAMLLVLVLAQLVVVTLSYVPLIGRLLATMTVGAMLALFLPIAFIAFYTSYADVFEHDDTAQSTDDAATGEATTPDA